MICPHLPCMLPSLMHWIYTWIWPILECVKNDRQGKNHLCQFWWFFIPDIYVIYDLTPSPLYASISHTLCLHVDLANFGRCKKSTPGENLRMQILIPRWVWYYSYWHSFSICNLVPLTIYPKTIHFMSPYRDELSKMQHILSRNLQIEISQPFPTAKVYL